MIMIDFRLVNTTTNTGKTTPSLVPRATPPRRGIAHISGVLSFPSVEGWHAKTHKSTGERRKIRVTGWFLRCVRCCVNL